MRSSGYCTSLAPKYLIAFLGDQIAHIKILVYYEAGVYCVSVIHARAHSIAGQVFVYNIIRHCRNRFFYI